MEFEHARDLRKNMTDAERLLWGRIRRRQIAGVKFRRQAPIGHYIVDFAAFEPKLVVELDGGQHVEQAEYDRRRTEWLVSRGFQVLRFWNHEVFEDLDTVLDAIWKELTKAGVAGIDNAIEPNTQATRTSPPQRSTRDG